MTPGKITRSVQGLNRLRKIAQVLTRHGFGHVVDRVHLGRFVPVAKLWQPARKPALQESPLSLGQRLARVCEDLGPTFVKLGQTVSTRADLVQPDILEGLRTLHDRVAPFPSDTAESIIADQLGAPVSQQFSSFDTNPIACGSIGQVHRAVTKDGRNVVVKVQRPGIDETIRADITVLGWLAEALEQWVPESRPYRPQQLVEEFEQAIISELDYSNEAATTERFRRFFRDNGPIVIPEVCWELSGSKVLTLEAMTGAKVDALSDAANGRFDRKLIASRLVEAYLRQFFEFGVFHADPHPGNLLINAPGRITLIDFGQVGLISDELADQLLVLLMAFVYQEPALAVDVLGEMGALGPATDNTQLQRAIRVLDNKYYGQPLNRVDPTELFQESTEIMRRHAVTMPRDIVLMMKALTTVWGVALALDPQLNLMTTLRGRIKALVRSRMSPRRVGRTALVSSWHLLGVLRTAPRHLRSALRNLAQGKWQLNVRHENLDQLAHEIDRSSNRLAFSVVIAAVIVGSSLVLSSSSKLDLFGIGLEWFALVGYVVAGVLGLGLLWAIFRSGRLS